MHPYEELCHLLHEYRRACEEHHDDGALRMAMHIREAASRLVVLAAQNTTTPTDLSTLGVSA